MDQIDDNRDVRPRPDPTVLTTAQLDREIRHLKELMDRDRSAQQEALKVALTQMDRRLEELPELRTEIVKVHNEFVRSDVYAPAHEELRRQRVADNERITVNAAKIENNATDLAELRSSLMWLSRLVIGAVILALIAFGFRALTGR